MAQLINTGVLIGFGCHKGCFFNYLNGIIALKRFVSVHCVMRSTFQPSVAHFRSHCFTLSSTLTKNVVNMFLSCSVQPVCRLNSVDRPSYKNETVLHEIIYYYILGWMHLVTAPCIKSCCDGSGGLLSIHELE